MAMRKDLLKTGDIILVSGNSWLAKEIQEFTKSNVSHVGIVYRCYDEVFICEQDFTKTDPLKIQANLLLTNIEEYFKSSKKFYFRRPVFEVEGVIIGKQILSDLGRSRYSYFDLLVAQPIYQITGKWIGDKNAKNKRMVCSSYVSYIFNKLYSSYSDWYKRTPGDFVNDILFKDIKI